MSDVRAKGKTYTYIGSGAASPQKINFMGVQEFIRGTPVEVTDTAALKKLSKHPCFVEGSVKAEVLSERDEAALKAEAERRAVDARVQANATKQNSKFKTRDEED